MKVMKKVTICLLAVCMVFSLAACGGINGEEQVVALSYVNPDMPVMKTIVTLTAIGDVVQTEENYIELDLTDMEEETKEGIISFISSTYTDRCDGLSKVTLNMNTTDTTFTLTCTIDYSGDNTELVEAGLIDNGLFGEKGNSRVSLTKTQQSLEAQGFRVITE